MAWWSPCFSAVVEEARKRGVVEIERTAGRDMILVLNTGRLSRTAALRRGFILESDDCVLRWEGEVGVREFEETCHSGAVCASDRGIQEVL